MMYQSRNNLPWKQILGLLGLCHLLGCSSTELRTLEPKTESFYESEI